MQSETIFKEATIHFFEQGVRPVQGKVGFSDEPFRDGKLRLKSVEYNGVSHQFSHDDASKTLPHIYCLIFDGLNLFTNSEFRSIILERQWVFRKED